MLPPKPNQALCPQLQHCYCCLPSKKHELPEVRSHIFKAHHRANLWKMPNDCIDAPSHSIGWRAVAHHGELERGGPGNKRCILCRELKNSPEKPSQSHSSALAFLNPVVDKILLPSKMDFSFPQFQLVVTGSFVFWFVFVFLVSAVYFPILLHPFWRIKF